MHSDSTATRATVAREDNHTSPWWSSAELDAIVEAVDALDAPRSSRRRAPPAVDLAAQWRAARARLDRALDARRSMLLRPVSEWASEEREWRAALRDLEYAHLQLDGGTAQSLVAEWRARIERATGEPPRRPWVQLSLLSPELERQCSPRPASRSKGGA